MTIWAHVRAGLVVATTEGLTPPIDDQSLLVSVAPGADVQPGDTYDGQDFAVGALRDPVVVPASVTMRQGREALIRAGLDEAVDAAIAAIQDPVSRKVALNAWTMSNNFERRNGFISQLGPAIGLTDEQIDALFIAAARLE